MEYDRYLTPAARDRESVLIRQVVDMIRGKDVIPLAAGWPNPESFPVELLSDLVRERLAERGAEMLQYSGTRGVAAFRERVAARLRARDGMAVSADEVLVTSGSQQGLYLLGRALVGDDDVVAVGAPTYAAALSAFGATGTPSYASIPIGADGLDLDAFEKRLETVSPTFVYTIPTYQNPTGITMPETRRRRLVDLAREHDFLIVEDDPYSELGFGDAAPPSIASIDRDRTVYLGTVSKVLAPGIRVGWVIARQGLLDALAPLKQPIDLHTSTFCQHVAAEYLRTGEIDDQIGRIADLYAAKRDIALETLAETMPDGVRWSRPDGGMFLWLTLPSSYDAFALLEHAIDHGVAFVPGRAFYATEPRDNTVRLNYTYVSDDELEAGVRRLARAIRTFDQHGD